MRAGNPRGKAAVAATQPSREFRLALALAKVDPVAESKHAEAAEQAAAAARSLASVSEPAPSGSVRQPRRPVMALALAGGGPLGGIYEIGALAALSEALDGIDLNDLDMYVGVSAGGFLAASLANGITPRQMVRKYIESRAEEGVVALLPERLLRPAFKEYVKRAAAVPPLLLASVWEYVTNPLGATLYESFQRLGSAVPTGIFDSNGIQDYLTQVFSKPGRTNDFRQLKRKLFLVATDLDSGESVAFGAPGHDHVPIATAVRATAALPGLFPPVEVEGHYYVDGALKKTLHASIALKQGAQLLLCINPLVPFDSDLAAKRGTPKHASLVHGGLPVVLSQTFRAIIHSRMQVGMAKYGIEYKDADIVLFEPNRDDADMFFTNVFSYASRRRLSEHAYQKTRLELYRRRHELGPLLARHGIRMRLNVLKDKERTLCTRPETPRKISVSRAAEVAADLYDCLDDLQRWLDQKALPPRRKAA